MPVLIIDEFVQKEIRRVKEYAEAHPTTLEDLYKIKSGEKQAIGYDSHHCLVLSDHYRTVYSQEYQPGGNLYHHLSISVPGRISGKMPSQPAVEMIMQEFGMGNNLKDCDEIWLENNAVNIVKKIDMKNK